MTTDAVVDNDVLIKAACYSLLTDLLIVCGGESSLGILGAARFVVRDRLARDQRIIDRNRAITNWQAFLPKVQQLEPTDAAVEMATIFEETAAESGLALDVGESLLCAIAIQDSIPALLTGDKRAIEAIEVLAVRVVELTLLAGRVVCLEQLIEAVVDRIGATVVRDAVCGEPYADTALTICFQCGQGSRGRLDPEGLDSYVRALRVRAPTMLVPVSPF